MLDHLPFFNLEPLAYPAYVYPDFPFIPEWVSTLLHVWFS